MLCLRSESRAYVSCGEKKVLENIIVRCLDSHHLALRILYRARAERKGTMEVTAVQTNQGLL